MRMLPFTFRSIEELELGDRWRAVFEERWPHYREWFLREGEEARPSYATSARMLRAHMPELVPAYERVVELAGGGDLAARMLSLYQPPPFLAACSQGAWTREGGPLLARNYDYAPSRFEGLVWSTRLLDRRVIGMSDCLWGLLDGMNDAGLAVSLTFGGRQVLGDGFGIPIVTRYVLETCATVEEARVTLARLPYSLSHNLTLVDRSGRVLTRTSRPTVSRSSATSRRPPITRGSSNGPSKLARPARSNASKRSFVRWGIPRWTPLRSPRASCGLRSSRRRTPMASGRSTRRSIASAKGSSSTAGPPSPGG
jgi:Predicted choloylglycine hydrolase